MPTDFLTVLDAPEGLEHLLLAGAGQEAPPPASGDGIERLEAVLPDYIGRQRWFGAKAEGAVRVEIADVVRLPAQPQPAARC